MTARNLLTLLREKGVEIRTSGADRIVIDAPKGTITPQLRDELAANKADLLRILHTEQMASHSQSLATETPAPSAMPPGRQRANSAALCPSTAPAPG